MLTPRLSRAASSARRLAGLVVDQQDVGRNDGGRHGIGQPGRRSGQAESKALPNSTGQGAGRVSEVLHADGTRACVPLCEGSYTVVFRTRNPVVGGPIAILDA
jgi:hypothetical protein